MVNIIFFCEIICVLDPICCDRGSGLGGESRSGFTSTVAKLGKFCNLCASVSLTVWKTHGVAPVYVAKASVGTELGFAGEAGQKYRVEKQPPKTKLPFQACPIFLNFLLLVFKKRKKIKRTTHYFSIFGHRNYFNF